MQEWLRFKDIFMYFSHNECKSLTAERFIKVNIYKKMTANNNISYLSYLNKLVNQQIMLIKILFVKNFLMLIILLWLKKIETNLKAPSFNITNYNSFLVKVTPQICLEKYFSNSVLKTNPCTFKIKDVTVKKIVGSFYRKELLRSTL